MVGFVWLCHTIVLPLRVHGLVYSKQHAFSEVVLGRGDLYVHEDMISAQDAAILRKAVDKAAPAAEFQQRTPELKCKKRTVRMVGSQTVRSKIRVPLTHVMDMMQDRISTVIEQMRFNTSVFGFRGGPLFQAHSGFFTYLPGGCHRPHADTDDPGRVVTAVLSLSDSSADYQGGTLNFRDAYADGPKQCDDVQARALDSIKRGEPSPFAVTSSLDLPPRAVVVFLAETLHEVEPVTKGKRNVYLQWFTMRPEREDPVAKQRRATKMRLSRVAPIQTSEL